jgi:drug/metabolite transporter (DMT)-like permease
MKLMMIQNRYTVGLLFTLLGAFLFSSKGVLAKWMMPLGADPLDILGLRMAFAVPIYIGLVVFQAKRNQKQELSKRKKPLTMRQWIKVLLLGFIGYYLSSMLDFHGLRYVSAGLERMIIFLYPSFVLVLSVLIGKEHFSRRNFLALCCSYVGIALVYMGDTDLDPERGLYGSLLILTAAFIFAIFLIIGEGLIKEIGPARFTNYGMIVAGFLVLVHFYVMGHQFDFVFKVYLAGFVLGVFGTVIPSYCMNQGISILGSSRASILSTFGPISTLVLGVLVLKESFGTLEIVGITFVISAGFFVKRKV